MTELKIIFHPIEQKIRIKEKISQNTWADIKQNPTQKFIQDLPGDFFRNLFKNYDEKNIQITFKGTVMDYEDLKQMVAFYNGQNEDTKLSLLENFEELPSVENCYREIKATSKKILNSLQQDITYESDGKIKEEFEFLSKTIDIAANAEEEPIHLCFIGAYSTGKSTVINALLGSKILPDAEESKTAKIFKINNSNNISLELKISGSATEEFICIEENRQTKSLELVKDSSDKSFNEELKYRISNCQKNGTSLDGQLLEMLDYLNDKENVLEITINYPIEFLNDTKCVIYDTPGADSDESQNHEAVLDSILKQQKNCILFVILSPTKTEGTGNRRVFELLSDAETTKSNSNGINLSMERCFYVYNMADTMNTYKEGLENKELKLLTVAKDDDGNIKETESKIIKMANHRVFLTSAAWGLAASKKFLYDKDDKAIFLVASQKKSFYKKNLSVREQEIKKVIDYCDKEKEATDDVDKKLLIDSGIFALQKSIHDYVNKYSTAIHAHRFFTEIKKPIEKFSAKVDSLAENISKVATELKEEQEKLTTSIVASLEKLLEDENKKIDKLELDKNLSQEDKSNEIIKFISDKIDSTKLTWIFGKQKVDQVLNRIENDVSVCINSKIQEMNVAYEGLRSQKKETFKNLVIELLKNNGVSQCKITTLTSTNVKVKDISHKTMIDTFIWSWVSKKNKNSYKDDLMNIARTLFIDCSKQYESENIKNTIKEDYEEYIDLLKNNIDKESSEIKDIIEKREEKEKELAKLKPVSEKLDNYIESLMKVMDLEENEK